jgi:dsRNA-specific ribonuclease
MAKDRLVSNSRLYKATLNHGIDKFILHHPFTGRSWKPPYIDSFASDSQTSEKKTKKEQSTKTLADVIEALIGASFVDGGIEKALTCISVLIPDLEWMTPFQALGILKKEWSLENHLAASIATTLAPVEEMIGYTFAHKAVLVEALTHGSYTGPSSRSLERFEFVGDALLDQIVVERLFCHDPPLSHEQMHLLRTAVVNSDFLAFLVLDLHIYEDRILVSKDGSTLETTKFRQSLWRFMRHSSSTLGIDALATEKRHAELRDSIHEALNTADRYPWALLARLQAKKFLSDIFESLLCAVWIDSGSMEACEDLLEIFGIFDFLARLVEDNVEVIHPKGKLCQLAVDKKVRYVVTSRDCTDGEEYRREYLCSVMVDDVCVAKVDGGVDREEVRSRAAEVAIQNWNQSSWNGDA